MSIWKDRWLPMATMFKVVSPVKDLNADALVSELIDAASKDWNRDLVGIVFLHHEAEVICQLPLRKRLPTDSWMWHYNSKGLFFVRSAYHLSVEKRMRDLHSTRGETSTSRNEDLLMKVIWKQGIPSKIKHFMWKACLDILPTKSNLLKRKVPVLPQCEVCGTGEESVLHALKECPWAEQV